MNISTLPFNPPIYSNRSAFRLIPIDAFWRLLVSAVLLPVAAQADSVIAYWDFGPDETGYTTSVTVDNAVGTPMLTGMSAGSSYDTDGQAGVGFTDADGAIYNAGQSLAWGSGVNDGDQEWILQLNLTGYTDINIRWDYRSTGTGPTNAIFDYRIDAGDWTGIEEISMDNNSVFHAYDKDLAAITAIDNQAAVEFRLSGFSGGTSSGTHRIDNVQIFAVPEPAVLSLVILFGIGSLAVRRWLG